jgi:hypothetical protein
MPDMEVELEHLAEADRHIALARDNIARVESSATGVDQPAGSRDRLETLKETLVAFEGHRDIILKTIEGLRDGSLPDRT